jgi:2-dehydro-3-deoxyglucarate aldolase
MILPNYKMKRIEKIHAIRNNLKSGSVSIGSWMQLPNASVAEILGQAGYDWVAVDLEHGTFCNHQLPDIFRALELGGTLPLVRLAHGHPRDCKDALDAGAGGVIVPMVESAEQLQIVRDACCWPPSGTRGVGFSRANLFGKNFDEYNSEAQAPLLVAMIEHVRALNQLDEILQVDGLDAILVGPYDLSASMGKIGQLETTEFMEVMGQIKEKCTQHKKSCGVHVVMPDVNLLDQRIAEGYRFLAYSIDSVFLLKASDLNDWKNAKNK